MLSKPTVWAPNFPMGNPNKQKGKNQQLVHMVTVTTLGFYSPRKTVEVFCEFRSSNAIWRMAKSAGFDVP